MICDSLENKSRIFATARGYGEFKGGWEFPGGKLEEGENSREALSREIREELATEITVGDLIDTIEYDYPEFHLSMDCFWCEVVSGSLELLEAEDARWLGKNELRTVSWLPADLSLIDKLEAALLTETDPAKAIDTLGQKLLNEGLSGTANAVCSPISLYLLLALAGEAAGGNTREEIGKLLTASCGTPEFRDRIFELQKKLTKKERGTELTLANGICMTEELRPKLISEFRKEAENLFAADIFSGGRNPLKKINSWVNKQTKGRIPKLLNELPQPFKLCLLNAVSFTAKWEKPYEDFDILPKKKFRNADGTFSEPAMLCSSEEEYIEDSRFTGFVRNYQGGDFAFLALLPKDPKAGPEAFSDIDFPEYFRNCTGREVSVQIPEFRLESSLELTEFLKKLGIRELFTPEADFGGAFSGENIMASSVLQKTVLELDRKGTKAASVSAMICVAGCAPDFEKRREVILDRPFAFAVINRELGGIPVFSGVVRKL